MIYAIRVDGDALLWAPADPLPVADGQIRIAVQAAGVNRADLVQRAGRYPPPPGASPILGLEAAGVVTEAVGTSRFAVGDRVMALLAGGGYASEVVVDARHALPVPDSMTMIDAAATMEVFATAWLNLALEAGLKDHAPGAKVLLHAGGSGVGTAGIQILRSLGHEVAVTAGSAAKLAACADLGAHWGANRHDGPWIDRLKSWAPQGVDVILDPVGANYFGDNLRALRTDGTLVLIGLLSGRSADIDLGRVLVRRLRVRGSTLRARSADAKADLVASIGEHLLPAWASGSIRPIVDRAYPIADADQAHKHLASNTTLGSLVLTVDDGA